MLLFERRVLTSVRVEEAGRTPCVSNGHRVDCREVVEDVVRLVKKRTDRNCPAFLWLFDNLISDDKISSMIHDR